MKGTNAIRTGIIAAIVVVISSMARVTPIRILLVAAMLGVVMASPDAPAVAESRSMSVVALYLLLLKATVTSFAGMGSLPQIRQDFVVTHGVITDEELGQAVVLGRSAPGPVGAYVVAIGYFAGGWPGAIAAWLAMITPALLVIPLLTLLRRWLHLPRVRAAVDAVVIASAVLLLTSAVRMAMDSIEMLRRVFG